MRLIRIHWKPGATAVDLADCVDTLRVQGALQAINLGAGAWEIVWTPPPPSPSHTSTKVMQ